MQDVPAAPKITFPYDHIDTLSTNIAWIGDVADAFEVKIVSNDDYGTSPVWQSGVIETYDSFAKTPLLPPDSELYAFVRLRNSVGWSEWSKSSSFTTPASPTLRIVEPAHAGRAKGPDVDVRWEIESHDPISSQSISIDGARPSEVPASERSYKFRGLAQGVHNIKIGVSAAHKVIEHAVTFYVYNPVQHKPAKLYTMDLTKLRRPNIEDQRETTAAFDTLHIVAVLQGLVNREEPQFFIDFMNVDQFWLSKIRSKGGYLEHSELAPFATIEDAITVFSEYIEGAVIWDPNVPSTSYIASTICGAENLLPIRYDKTPGSMYDRLINAGPRLKVIHNLVGKFTGTGKIPDTDRDSTGSRKCDSYIWAKMLYIDTGKCNPAEIGYWCDAFWLNAPDDMSLDNVGLTNHDFIIARKGFFCDLDVWADETPRDDPNQRYGLDLETLKEIFLSCYKANNGGMIHFSGFTPWAIKYTDRKDAGGKHSGVPTEWEMVRIASAYNVYIDADAIGYVGLANASIFQHCPLPDRLIQNRIPTRRDLEAKGYIHRDGDVARLNFIYHYLGDYDSAAWMYNGMPNIWSDPVRGQVPSGWAFNPNLIERMPVVFDWCYDTKTPNDFFIAGDSGAGYINPTALLQPRDPSSLPSGAKTWIEHNIPYFRKLNYSITGFVINGFCGELTDDSNRMYTSFSSDGIMTQVWMPREKKHDHLLDNMVVAHMEQDLDGQVERAVQDIIQYGESGKTSFRGFRSILKSSGWIKSVNDGIRGARPEYRFTPVDPYTYFYLRRYTLGGNNDYRATYTFDTMQNAVKANQIIEIKAGVRNDGWDTWKCAGDRAVKLTAGFIDQPDISEVSLPDDVPPGEGAVVSIKIKSPNKPGKYALKFELKRGADAYFGKAGDLPWIKEVVVE